MKSYDIVYIYIYIYISIRTYGSIIDSAMDHHIQD
jgi:hypothetical protein